MRRFLQMLLAVLFCTTALCITDVNAATTTNNSNSIKTINIATSQSSVRDIQSTAINSEDNAYSHEEVYLTAQLIHHEAHNQPYDGKVAIAEVVLNRVRSKIFPNSIDDVIFQTGQFTSVRRIKNISPTEQEVRIADRVLNGKLRVFNDSGILYFRNPKVTSGLDAETDKDWGSLDYVTCIGDHAFYSQMLFNKALVDSSTDKYDSSKKKSAADEAEEDTDKSVIKTAKAEEPAEETVEEAQDEVAESSLLAVADAESEDENKDVADVESDDALEDSEETEEITNEMLVEILSSAEEDDDESEEEEFDENDPVARAQRQAKLDAEREEKTRAALEAANVKANEAASAEAQINVKQATMRVEAILLAGQVSAK